jgi:hypothetical protein
MRGEQGHRLLFERAGSRSTEREMFSSQRFISPRSNKSLSCFTETFCHSSHLARRGIFVFKGWELYLVGFSSDRYLETDYSSSTIRSRDKVSVKCAGLSVRNIKWPTPQLREWTASRTLVSTKRHGHKNPEIQYPWLMYFWCMAENTRARWSNIISGFKRHYCLNQEKGFTVKFNINLMIADCLSCPYIYPRRSVSFLRTIKASKWVLSAKQEDYLHELHQQYLAHIEKKRVAKRWEP